MEGDDEGRFGAGRLQWKPLFNRQLQFGFDLCESEGKVMWRECHRAEPGSPTRLCLVGIGSERINWRPGRPNTNQQLAGRRDVQGANPAAL